MKQEIKMPDQQEGTESVLSSWLKKQGELISQHEPIAEVTTDKVTMEIASPYSGELVEIIKKEGESVSPGEVIAFIAPKEVSVSKSESKTISESAPIEESTLSPAVRRLLKEKGLDASQVKGSGPGGRILIEDIERLSSNSKRVPHSVVRKSIAHHMVESIKSPHVTTVFECDFSAIINHREENRSEFESKGAKLSFTPYFILAALEGLRAVPELNSRWFDDGLEIFEEYNIGIATSLDKDGLIVPVIRNTEKLSLFEVAKELQTLVQKARDGGLSPKEVQGGTFTISNHGMTGSLIATPIINQPQSGILGVGKLEKRVVVGDDEKFLVKPKAYVTLTFDHRVMDGTRGNDFLRKFVEVIEAWNL